MAKKLNANEVQRLIELFDDEEAGDVSLDESEDSLEINEDISDEEDDEEPLPSSTITPSIPSSSKGFKNNGIISQSISSMSISSTTSNKNNESKNNNFPQSASVMSVVSINNNNNISQSCTNNFVTSNIIEDLVIPSPIPAYKFFKTPLKIDSPAKISSISKVKTPTSKFNKKKFKSKTTSICNTTCKKIVAKSKSENKNTSTKSSHVSLVNYFLLIFIQCHF